MCQYNKGVIIQYFHRAFALTLAAGMFSISSVQAKAIDADDLFNLSLEDLSEIRVTGAAIRSLNLDLIPATNNPHHLNIHSFASSIDVVDSKTIEARGLKNVVEVVESMVGVLSGESPSEPYSFSMRGFSRNSVTVLYDGISLGLSTLNMRPLNTFNIERVEVVKGANTILAPTTAGGTVNIISKKPELAESKTMDVLTRYGRFNNRSVEFSMNAPINQKSAYRIDLNRNESDGWVDESHSGSVSGTAALIIKPVDNMDVTFSLNHLDDHLPAYWGTPLVPAASAQSPNTSVLKRADQWVIDESTRFNNYNVSDSIIDSNSLWSRLDLHWHYSEATVVKANLYSYKADRLWQNAETYNFDETDGQIHRDRLLIAHERYLRGFKFSFTHEFGDADTKHSLAVNYESSINDFTRDVGFDLAEADFYDIDSVSFASPIQGVFGPVDKRNDKQTHIIDSISAQHRVTFNDRLNLELGVKHDQIIYDRIYINFDKTIRERATLDTSFGQFSGRLAGHYKLSEQSSMFVQYSTAHDPIEDDIKFIYDFSNYEESDITSMEVGIKSHFNQNQTELLGSLYQIEKTSTYQSSTDTGTNQQNSLGLDLAVKHEFSEQMRIGGNYAYVDASYGDFYDSETGTDATNNVPVNVPEQMLSAWMSYDNVMGLPIEVGGGFNYVSKRFANSANTAELKAYQLWNLFAAYQGKQFRLSANIRNVTDEIYAPWSDIYYPNQVALGSPRTVDVTFRARF